MNFNITAHLWVNILKTKIANLPDLSILFLNRNARVPKKANHGARPCSSVMRRERKKEVYRRWKRNTPGDQE